MSRPMYADRVLVRVYIEGVLFPYAKSVVVSESESGVRCQIEVPPSAELRPEQWAGATVHVFYANRRVMAMSDEGDPEDKGWVDAIELPDDLGWPILFQGELSGESAQATVQSETVILNAIGHSRHFDQAMLFFYDFSKGSPIEAYAQAHFLGNQRIDIEAEGVLSKQTQLLTTMTSRIASLDTDSDRNIAFTSTILEILRSVKAQHPIYNYFDQKLKLSQRFAAYVDPDVKTMLQLEQMKHLIDQRAQTLPSYASVMNVLDLAIGTIHYNWNHLAQPQLRHRGMAKLEKDGREIEVDVQQTQEVIFQAIDEFLREASPSNLKVSTILGTIHLPKDYFEKANKEISKTEFANRLFKLDPENLLEAFQQLVVRYERPMRPNLQKRSIKEKNQSGMDDLEDASAAQSMDPESEEKVEKTIELLEIDQKALEYRDELNEFIITPNLRFTQPPKCNVFLPSSFTSYGIQRDHFREPTRLYGRVPLMKSGDPSGQGLYEWYIAPYATAYHHLEGTDLDVFTPQYRKFVREQMEHREAALETEIAIGKAEEKEEKE